MRNKMRATETRDEIDEGNGKQRVREGKWIDG